MTQISPAQVSRRGFLIQSGAATVAVAGATATLGAHATTPVCGVPLSASDALCVRDVALQDFRRAVGDSFQVYAPTGAAMLTLKSAQAQSRHAQDGQRPLAARREPFSLLFVATAGADLLPGIHEFTHPSLGVLKLSLNAVGDPEVGPAHYEVAFG